VLLDLNLPDGHGLALLARWRAVGVTTPLIVITASDALGDRLAGLDGGADDFIVKPFAVEELVSRVRAVVRRMARQAVAVWRFGDLSVDPQRRECRVGDTVVALSPREFEVLATLARSSGRVVLALEASFAAVFVVLIAVLIAVLSSQAFAAGTGDIDKALRANARAADPIRRENAFVHDAAHELRTPLAVIATQAHLLAGAQGDDRALALRRLEDSITRASHLAHQLLRLANADAVARAERVPVDLMDLLRDAMATLAERAHRQRTAVSIDGPDSASLRADPHALRSIVDTLLDNALRYGGPGGAVALRERAFERFWRGASGTQPGSGLGLAIVREAVRVLGGSVRLDAGEDGVGCVAVVAWPVDPPDRPRLEPPAGGPDPRTTAA
jgi:signal transduction histidine kinase